MKDPKTWNNFKSWRDIRKWANKNGFKNLVARMDLNDRCWESSGEFGRSQVYICDSIRNADSEEDAIELASEMNEEMKTNYGLWS